MAGPSDFRQRNELQEATVGLQIARLWCAQVCDWTDRRGSNGQSDSGVDSCGEGVREVTEEDSSFDGVTEEELYEALFDLVCNGLLRPTGEYRTGQPVYIATPEEEKSDEAKAYENKISRHRPN